MIFQDYSRLQFTSLPSARQDHAYKMFLALDLDTLAAVIGRELENQREVELLFGAEAGDRYGEFEQLRLGGRGEGGGAEFRITSHQIQQLQEELDHNSLGEGIAVTDEGLEEQDDASGDEVIDPSCRVLQISPGQLDQLQLQIQALEPPSSGSSGEVGGGAGTNYNEDFYEVITGVNQRLGAAQQPDDTTDESHVTLEPSTTPSPPSPQQYTTTTTATTTSPSELKTAAPDEAALTLTHTTLDGLELSNKYHLRPLQP